MDSNAIDAVPSTTVRAARPRPTFNIRPRGRNVVSTTAPPASDAPAQAEDKVDEEVKEVKEAPAAPVKTNPALAGRSRLNARPNPLLNLRGRSNLLGRGQTTTTAAPEAAAEAVPEEDLQETDVPSETAEKEEEAEKQVRGKVNSDSRRQLTGFLSSQPAPEVTTPATGLNRLRNRARLQVHKPEKPKAQAPVVNRRANPLIARRNLFSSTTEGEWGRGQS